MTRLHFAVFLEAIALSGGLARGSIIFDQPPQHVGGPAADTEFVNDNGGSEWQQVADDIMLGQTATINKIVWYGFYGGSFGPHQDPPSKQSMRLRFYSPRLSDGLPGDILSEEIFVNPMRGPTGHTISIPSQPDEQRFEIDLASPFELRGGTRYWLEIVQFGITESHYRWEYSLGSSTPYAVANQVVPNWVYSPDGSNLAFQLVSVPEPTVLVFCVFGAAGLAFTRPKAR